MYGFQRFYGDLKMQALLHGQLDANKLVNFFHQPEVIAMPTIITLDNNPTNNNFSLIQDNNLLLVSVEGINTVIQFC